MKETTNEKRSKSNVNHVPYSHGPGDYHRPGVLAVAASHWGAARGNIQQEARIMPVFVKQLIIVWWFRAAIWRVLRYRGPADAWVIAKYIYYGPYWKIEYNK